MKQRHPASLRNDPPSRPPRGLDALSPPPLPASTSNKHPHPHPYQQLCLKSNEKNSRTGKDSFRLHRTIFGACALYLGFLISLAILAFHLHYSLPTPVSSADGALVIDPLTGQKQFSEENVRRVVRHLSEDIGYRVVGTEQDQETQVYLMNEIQALREQAEKESAKRLTFALTEGGGVIPAAFPTFDVWTQKDDGAHQFDFMSKGMLYSFISLILLALSLSQVSANLFVLRVELSIRPWGILWSKHSSDRNPYQTHDCEWVSIWLCERKLNTNFLFFLTTPRCKW